MIGILEILTFCILLISYGAIWIKVRQASKVVDNQDRALQPRRQDHDDIRGRLSVPVVDPNSVRGLGTVRHGSQIFGGRFRVPDQSGRSLRLRGIHGHPSSVSNGRLSGSEMIMIWNSSTHSFFH